MDVRDSDSKVLDMLLDLQQRYKETGEDRLVLQKEIEDAKKRVNERWWKFHQRATYSLSALCAHSVGFNLSNPEYEQRLDTATNHLNARTLRAEFLPRNGVNPEDVQVRVVDFVEWAGGMGWELPDQMKQTRTVPATSNAAKQGPLQRQRYQEEEILRVIGELGHDAQALPKNNGRRGVKAEVRDMLGNRGVWAKTSVFNQAWQRLRDSNRISNA